MSKTTMTTVGLFDADPAVLAEKSAAVERAEGLELRIAAGSLGQLLTSPAFPPDVVIVQQRSGERVSIDYKVRVCRLADARVIVVDSGLADEHVNSGAAMLMTSVGSFHEALALLGG